MRRTFTERFIVGLSDRVFNAAADFMEEVILPFSLLSRWVRGKLPLWMAWDIFRSTWAPFRRYRRWQGRRSVRKDQSYRGDDEFHPSLDMNVSAMLAMDDKEVERYLADLCRRRQRLHESDIAGGRE